MQVELRFHCPSRSLLGLSSLIPPWLAIARCQQWWIRRRCGLQPDRVVHSRHSSSSSGMAGSEAPRFALRCSGLFLVRRFRACRSRQRRFSASAWRRLGDEDVSEFGTNEQRSLLFESATFCLCVCKCMLTDACLYAYVVWVCLCVWRHLPRARVCACLYMYA